MSATPQPDVVPPGDPLPAVFQRLRSGIGWLDRPWLIVGKGPSFEQFDVARAGDWRILTLNDAVRAVPRADLAHFIDLDAFERCADALGHTRCVVMPWFPHVDNRPGPQDLAALSCVHPVLARLRAEGRLLWYDLSSAPQRRGGHPLVTAVFFSAEAALDLLAAAGVRTIRSIGVDGGTDYGKAFAGLRGVSRFSNGQSSFDRQFESFARVIRRSGVDFAPLGIQAPVRVFVAATASERLPAQVLAHSIRRHASARVVVTPLCDLGIDIPLPRDPRHHPRTPFSFQRFLVPQACGHAGRAIYLDSDMLVFRDILSLWRLPFDGADVLTVRADEASARQPQFSVMLMDCDRLPWTVRDVVAALDDGRTTYERLMYRFAIARTRASIGPQWNSLERHDPDRTALLHYTDMATQPWVSWTHPLGYLWVQALREAMAEGTLTRDAVAQEVARGHVRPSLLYQLDHAIDDGLLLPAAAKALDRPFRPPYRALATHGASPWTSRWHWLRAACRMHYQRTWLPGAVRRLRRRWLVQGVAPPAA